MFPGRFGAEKMMFLHFLGNQAQELL